MGEEMITIRYDWQSAYNAGVLNVHPQKDMQDLGCKTGKYEAIGIASCSFIEVDKLPDPLPNYITVSNFKIQ